MSTIVHALQGIRYEWAVDGENVEKARAYLASLGEDCSQMEDSDIVATALNLKTQNAINGVRTSLLDIEPIGGWKH
jgi:hypothetical protein